MLIYRAIFLNYLLTISINLIVNIRNFVRCLLITGIRFAIPAKNMFKVHDFVCLMDKKKKSCLEDAVILQVYHIFLEDVTLAATSR